MWAKFYLGESRFRQAWGPDTVDHSANEKIKISYKIQTSSSFLKYILKQQYAPNVPLSIYMATAAIGEHPDFDVLSVRRHSHRLGMPPTWETKHWDGCPLSTLVCALLFVVQCDMKSPHRQVEVLLWGFFAMWQWPFGLWSTTPSFFARGASDVLCSSMFEGTTMMIVALGHFHE
jgi:hypothetical protein